jgi:hypothetical protein
MPAPPTTKPQSPPPEPEKKSCGFFGLGGKKKTKVLKADIADALADQVYVGSIRRQEC